jgi:hypothetical protein
MRNASKMARYMMMRTTCVATDATGGTFKALGKLACAPTNALTAIDGTAPAAEGGAGA